MLMLKSGNEEVAKAQQHSGRSQCNFPARFYGKCDSSSSFHTDIKGGKHFKQPLITRLLKHGHFFRSGTLHGQSMWTLTYN